MNPESSRAASLHPTYSNFWQHLKVRLDLRRVLGFRVEGLGLGAFFPSARGA